MENGKWKKGGNRVDIIEMENKWKISGHNRNGKKMENFLL